MFIWWIFEWWRWRIRYDSCYVKNDIWRTTLTLRWRWIGTSLIIIRKSNRRSCCRKISRGRNSRITYFVGSYRSSLRSWRNSSWWFCSSSIRDSRFEWNQNNWRFTESIARVSWTWLKKTLFNGWFWRSVI